jgi:energy-converting hydrogenase Eha subunit C
MPSVQTARLPECDPTTTHSLAPMIHWIFRISFFMEFVGHGAFGLLGGKVTWIPYFGVVGIGESTASTLMPLIGLVDVSIGILTLIRPMRAVLLYGVIWGFWTALLRPLSGEPFWELLERAGNYGVPLAFLLWSGWPSRPREWLARIDPCRVASGSRERVGLILRISLAALLIGHGGFGVFLQKEMLAKQWATVGVHGLPFGTMSIVPAAGWLDIALGAAVLLHPASWLLVLIAVWKISCELLYPISGAPIWEFVERGGSYAAPLLLLGLAAMRRSREPAASVATPVESAPA